jgi:transposase
MTDSTTFLSDAQWLLLQPLFPPSSRLKGTPGSLRGRPPLDNRPILENIFWKLSTRLPWYDIPSTSPSWQVCYQRLHRWQHTGIWKAILKILIVDLRQRGGFDLLELWDGGHLSVTQADYGVFELACPPEFVGTWQSDTALALLMALSTGYNSPPNPPCPY